MKRALFGLLFVACLGPELPLPKPRSDEARHGGTGKAAGATSGAQAARAFRIERRDDLLTGFAATGKVGDLKLENNKASFIVDAAQSRYGFAESGGNLIDAAPAGGEDALKQIFGYLDDSFPRQPVYDRVEVGQRGLTAVVRAQGRDSQNSALAIVTEYLLEPDTPTLEIVTTVTNTSDRPVPSYQIGDAIEWGRTERFTPGVGFRLPGAQTVPAGFLEAIGEDVAYAYVAEAGPLTGKHAGSFSDVNLAALTLEPGKSTTVRRFFIAALRIDADFDREVAAIRHERRARVGGRVVEELTGAPVDDARIFFDDPEGRPLAITTSFHGRYDAFIPPGEYRLRTEARGRRGPTRLGVIANPSQASQIDVLISRPGQLRYAVRSGGLPIAAKLTILGIGDTPAPRLGPIYSNPGGNVVLTATGGGTVPLDPGRYRVIASRGPTYSIDEQTIDVAPGAEANATFKIERELDLGGYVCGELHQHTTRSVDSSVTLEDRLTSDLAEGLDFFVTSDHNYVTDIRAPNGIVSIAGNEATHDGVGHFGAFPVAPDPVLPRAGAIDAQALMATEIVAQLRAGHEARAISVNHPRAGITGYFSDVGFDPSQAALPAGWEGGFDAVEILSSKTPTTLDEPMRDWFALLQRGHRYTAVGGSDSHFIVPDEVGYPRVCVAVADPRRFGADDVARAVKVTGDVLITTGPFIKISIAGKGMGQLVSVPRGRTRVEVEVDAAPWIDVRRLELFVGGLRRGKPIEIPPSKNLVRWKSGIDLKVNEDTFVVVIARGEASLEPILFRPEGRPPPLPIAITNPIYLDRDGDGKWAPPAPLPRKP